MVNTSEKKKLLLQHPFFSQLSTAEIDEFANLSYEKTFNPGDIIVSEGQIVDAFYLIAKGKIEVAHKETPDIILRKGEAIGLNRFDFFSDTGLRTATLTALSEAVLIGWDLETFYVFLQKHPEVNAAMLASAEKMLRLNFIKKVEPFADLPESRILWLASQIEERSFDSGEIIFNYGDEGNECYLVRSGEVEIKGIEGNTIALLTSSMLFGERAILTHSKRNATAMMRESGVLLVLNKEDFEELVEHHDIDEAMMILMVERGRPEKLAGVQSFEKHHDDDETVMILKDPKTKRYFQLSKEGWFLWELLDGERTLQDLTVEMYRRHKIFAPEAIADTLFNLADSGFVLLPEIHYSLDEKEGEKIKSTIWKWSHIQLTFDDIDQKFTQSYNRLAYIFFTPLGQVLMGIVILLGIVSCIFFSNNAIAILQSQNSFFSFVIPLFIVYLHTVIVHEFAHGYTTKYYGREVHHAGIVFTWIGLLAYVDTSDMWLSDKKARIAVTAAGPFADLVLAGISSILAVVISQPQVALFFWLLALLLYYSVFKNLNPIYENDGYAILKDFFDRPRFFNEWIFWLIAVFFLVAGMGIAYVFGSYLKVIFPITTNFHLEWILPTLVLINFVVRITREAVASRKN